MEYELKLNKDYCVVSANDLIKGKQRMTIQESKLLYIAISQVVKEDKDFKTYTTTIPELAEFLGITSDNLYRDIDKITDNLLQRFVKIKIDKNKWKKFQWVNRADYDNGVLTLRLSDDIKPYLLELEKHYSQFVLSTMLTFKSYYASRIYQLLVCDMMGKEEFEKTLTIEELRDFLQIDEKKFSRPFDLIKNTVAIAKEEINEPASNSCIIMDYRVNKQRRKGSPIQSITLTALAR